LGKDDVLSSLLLELRRGTIVLCVLAKLQKTMYGYNLVTALADSGIPVEANTLYPLLRRLESQGLLQSTWETGGSKPRKYYSTTPQGQQTYAALKTHWDKTVQSMHKLLEETDE
jgi:DNA-binding PadR family transcriptional regulator